MKHSTKRDLILKLFKDRSLLTANDVINKLPQIDKVTIYRNLTLLTSLGILREVNIKKGISSFELNIEGDYHQHFICKNCEKVIPVDVDIKKLKKILPKEISFSNIELNLSGKCRDCK